jgi:type I restriction enzyme S subunit
MASEWSMCTAGEIAATARNALVGGPFGSNLVSADYVESGVPVIRGQNMGSRWISGDFAFVSEDKALSLQSNLARPGDIVFTQRGTLGQVCLVPFGRFDKYLLSQSQMKLTPDSLRADSLFLYYLFSSEEQQDYIRQHAIQTGVPHTNLGILRDTPLLLPTIEEQRAIAHILGTLDDKIELNRKRNETLEAMARALFQSWFVDFDPVRAKAEGRDTGLPAHIADLFPDSFEDSELGPLPVGWKAMRVEDVSERIAMGPFGSSIKVETFVDAGVPVISGQHLRGFMLEDSVFNFITEKHAQRLAKAQVRRGDVVFTHAGSIGQAAFIPEESLYERYVISQRQFFMRCNHSFVTPSFIALYFGTDGGRHKLLANTSSSGVPSIARPVSYLRTIFIPVPPSAILRQFEFLTAPLLSKYRKNQDNNTSLTQLRDSLLPKLISGEIRVGRAERLIVEAGV